jgi:hypothetical protein
MGSAVPGCLDVHGAVVFGHRESRTGNSAFGRLVDDIVGQVTIPPARRVLDRRQPLPASGPARCRRAPDAPSTRRDRPHAYPCELAQSNRTLFSISRRKVLTLNDCATVAELVGRIFAFGRRYSAPKPILLALHRKALERQLREPLLQQPLVPLGAAA